MRFKKTFLNVVSLAGAAWLASVATPTAGSDLDDVRAKVRAKYPTVRQLPTIELASWLSDTNRPSPILLDVRTEAEYEVSHLPGARRVDSRASASQIVATLDRGLPVVTYCSVGYRSSQMAERLEKAGLTNVFNLDGSIFQWANEGKPLEQGGKPVHPYNKAFGKLLREEIRAQVPPVKACNATSELMLRQRVNSLTLLAVLLTWESLVPFFTYFVERRVERVRHGLKNVVLGVLNALLTGLGFAALWWATAQWARAHNFGMLCWLPLPDWARLAGAFLLFDAWMYWWHRLNHRIPFLWRFHRTHHSDPNMDVTTANRFHIGEIALSSVLRVPVIALLGLQVSQLALYEMAMFTVVQLHHANIALPAWLDRALRVVIVTPFMHKVHHSRWQAETDSNYSSLFSFWDRLFRSFRFREDPHTIQFGLQEFDSAENHTLIGLLTTPLKPSRRITVQPSQTNPLTQTIKHWLG
jgi:sterol desaturase/sphingolipid hydroxylase (fatty acid hydroxylase superfamily)/rhodanese-related sulfurtransferase